MAAILKEEGDGSIGCNGAPNSSFFSSLFFWMAVQAMWKDDGGNRDTESSGKKCAGAYFHVSRSSSQASTSAKCRLVWESLLFLPPKTCSA